VRTALPFDLAQLDLELVVPELQPGVLLGECAIDFLETGVILVHLGSSF
jgi:hypothetical protein